MIILKETEYTLYGWTLGLFLNFKADYPFVTAINISAD